LIYSDFNREGKISNMYLLGIDLGSSFVKASIFDGATGKCIGAGSSPDSEMNIKSTRPGWAEQDTEVWWTNTVAAIRTACAKAAISGKDIKAIGISYQMHGLVVLDKNNTPLRHAIIWCDSRAVEIGKNAFDAMGHEACLDTMLNSPGNFTASKLKWVKDNEPDIFKKIEKICLPGDYIALRLTGSLSTTATGLSEGIMWNFVENKPAYMLLDHYGIPHSFLPEIVPVFGDQGHLSGKIASELGLSEGTPVTYRAGDQPNNAFSLNVLEPGEAAATAGTSGVIYGVTDAVKVDAASRVNAFAHVNHSQDKNRTGVLLCVNGTGIANAWVKKLMGNGMSYDEMNKTAANVPAGSDGLVVLPFGNGAERMLGNKYTGASINGLDFNVHSSGHLCRAVQEGVAFSLVYGINILRDIGADVNKLRAGRANMFLSQIFRSAISDAADIPIELYNTDGAQGAARGAGVGSGYFKDVKAAFAGLVLEDTIEPSDKTSKANAQAYQNWVTTLEKNIK
jgi:xylulokinase